MLDRILDWFGFGGTGPGAHGHTHNYGHSHDAEHGHTHGVIDPSIAATDRGVWAVKWSFVIMIVTAVLQLAVVLWSSSVALLATTV